MKTPTIVALTGKAGCGKDTVANYLVDKHGFVKLSFAEPIKRGLNAMFGWSMAQWDDREWKEAVLPQFGKSPRQMAQTLGTQWGRDCVCSDLWIKLCLNRVNCLLDDNLSVVISDCRFDNEADMVRDRGGNVWHVFRKDTQAVSEHASEAGVCFQAGDRTITNDTGFEDLFSSVDLRLDISKK